MSDANLPAIGPDVIHDVAGVPIRQRASDGYFDATAMCRAHGKQFHDYQRLQQTEEFLIALSESTGIPVDYLVQSKSSRGGGTWVHPQLAVALAYWCAPEFAVRVTGWVVEWVRVGTVVPTCESHLVSQFIRELGPYHAAGLRDGIREGLGAVIPLVREIGDKADTAIGIAAQALDEAKSYGGRIETLEGEREEGEKREKRRKRKDLSPYDKRLLRLTVLRRFNGYCPVRGKRCLGRIVDDNGNRLRDSAGKVLCEYDHHYDVGSPDVRQSILHCRNCHADRTAQKRKDPRHKIQSEFETFQNQLEIVMEQEEIPLFVHAEQAAE